MCVRNPTSVSALRHVVQHTLHVGNYVVWTWNNKEVLCGSVGLWFLDVCSTARIQEGQKDEWHQKTPMPVFGDTLTKTLEVDVNQSRSAD